MNWQMSKRVLILSGPNAANIEARKRLCEEACRAYDLELTFEHSDDEAEIELQILSFLTKYDALVFNPGAPTANGLVSFRSAVKSAARGQIIEVHDSNIFIGKSIFDRPLQQQGDQIGMICGFGDAGNELAISALAARSLKTPKLTSNPKIRIINGPNLNLLGTREPEIYGHQTLDDICAECIATGKELGATVDFLQSNHEGELVDAIQSSISTMDGIIINAAAYTHTSVAIHDALKAYCGVKIELHISNPHAREPFRHHSFVSSAVDGVIAGVGAKGYQLAINSLAAKLDNKASEDL